MSETRRSRRDWAELRARVEEAGRRLLAEDVLDEARARAILRARAATLARRPAAPEEDPGTPWLAVETSGTPLLVDAAHVHAAVRAPRVTPLPDAEPPVHGLVAWRGRILTVLDVAPMLGARPRAGAPDFALVIGTDAPTLALLVDRVGDVTTVRAPSVRPLPEGQQGLPFARGVTDQAVLLVDVPALLHLVTG